MFPLNFCSVCVQPLLSCLLRAVVRVSVCALASPHAAIRLLIPAVSHHVELPSGTREHVAVEVLWCFVIVTEQMDV